MTATAEHPTAPEERTIDVNVEALDTRGRTLHGYAAVYGAESRDLGGFRERIAPGAFSAVLAQAPDVRALLNHDPNQVLGRTRAGTLRLFDEQRGLRFEVDLPNSPLGENVREAVARGDVDGASFRFIVGEEDWNGELRTVRTVRELHDVTVATYGAYPAASVELRTRPDTSPAGDTTAAEERQEEERTMQTEDREDSRGGLAVEDRAGTPETPTLEQRITEALRAVPRGENRSLTAATADAITPPELSSFLFDRLRATSVALASGMRVIPTDRGEIQFPQITADVDPGWTAEATQITASDPTLATLTATPKKLAARVEFSNEVFDDSDPSVVEVLQTHVATILGLKLDAGIFEGNQGADPNSIKGLKYVAGIGAVSMGTDGAAIADLDPFADAIGTLEAANARAGAIVMHPRTWNQVRKLKDAQDRPLVGNGSADAPPTIFGVPVFVTSQLSTTETQGTASDASSVYVYDPTQVVLIRRQDATIELDRSRLFDQDMSELRSKLRADLLIPNAAAVCRIVGVIPTA